MKSRLKIRIVYAIVIAILMSVAAIILVSPEANKAGSSPPLNGSNFESSAPAENLEGCLKCHDKIEPMHKFGPTATLDKLDHGKDALGLTCTACHGGNPVATEMESAHVRPRFPREWDKFKISGRSGSLLARESLEFVRFINPGDL